MRAAHLPIQAESPPRRSGAGVGTPAGMSDVPRRVAAPLPAARSSLASDRTVADYFDVNLAALAGRSPSVVEAVRSARAGQAVRTLQAASGAPILERDGGVLESRRDPVAAADRIAEGVGSDAVVVAGFGTGYLAEALRRRGVTVVAVVDAGPANLAAAMSVRDLRRLLGEIPVVLLDDLVDAVDLAVLWARTACLVPHGPSVTSSPSLGALVAEWPSVRVASRPPRLLVAGPLYGGSLEIARAVARAAAACGAEVQLFDAAAYAGAHAALGELRVGSRRTLQARLVALAGDAIVEVAAAWRPDLLVALAQAPIDAGVLARLRAAGVATAFWFVENGRVLRYWRDLAPHYDWFYAIQPGAFLERLDEAGAPRPRYLPVACDPALHAPVDLSSKEASRFGADVGFAGAAYLNRRRMFEALTDFDLRLWGPDWAEGLLAPYAAEPGRRFSVDEMVRIFAATRINVNLHSAEHVAGLDPDPDYVNPRTFELAACAAFQLVDRRDPLPALFGDDEIATFSSVAELRDLIARYLAREDERRCIAARARARARAEHTYTHRVGRILRDALPPELAAAAIVGRPAERLDDAIARLERDRPQLDREEALLRVVREVRETWVEGR